MLVRRTHAHPLTTLPPRFAVRFDVMLSGLALANYACARSNSGAVVEKVQTALVLEIMQLVEHDNTRQLGRT